MATSGVTPVAVLNAVTPAYESGASGEYTPIYDSGACGRAPVNSVMAGRRWCGAGSCPSGGTAITAVVVRPMTAAVVVITRQPGVGWCTCLVRAEPAWGIVFA